MSHTYVSTSTTVSKFTSKEAVATLTVWVRAFVVWSSAAHGLVQAFVVRPPAFHACVAVHCKNMLLPERLRIDTSKLKKRMKCDTYVLSFHRVFQLPSIYHPLKWSTNLHSLWPLPARAIPKILLLIAVRLKIPLPVIVHRVLPFAMYSFVVPPETAEAHTPDEPDYHEREVPRPMSPSTTSTHCV